MWSPPSEASLRNWVLSRVGRPGPLARCYSPRIEYRVPGPKKRFIDVLLNERGAAGHWTGLLAIEFELSSPAGTVGQLLEYLHLLSKTDLAEGKQLRGLIISGSRYGRELQHLTRQQPWPIEWYVVEAHLELVAASPV